MVRGLPQSIQIVSLNGLDREVIRSDPLREHLLHRVDEDVDLVERRVDIGGDSNAFELVVLDRDGHDPLLVPQVVGELGGVDPFNSYEPNPSRWSIITQGSPNFDAISNGKQSLGPAVA